MLILRDTIGIGEGPHSMRLIPNIAFSHHNDPVVHEWDTKSKLGVAKKRTSQLRFPFSAKCTHIMLQLSKLTSLFLVFDWINWSYTMNKNSWGRIFYRSRRPSCSAVGRVVQKNQTTRWYPLVANLGDKTLIPIVASDLDSGREGMVAKSSMEVSPAPASGRGWWGCGITGWILKPTR